MEGLSSKADSVSLGPRDECVGEQCTSIFLLPPLFLKDFMVLCESGNTPASQPPCKGFVGDRTLVRSLCSCQTLKCKLIRCCNNYSKAVLKEKLW